MSIESEFREPVDNLVSSRTSTEQDDDGLFGEQPFREIREVLFLFTDSGLYELLVTDKDWSDFLLFLEGCFLKSSSSQSSTTSFSESRAWVTFFLGSWLTGYIKPKPQIKISNKDKMLLRILL